MFLTTRGIPRRWWCPGAARQQRELASLERAGARRRTLNWTAPSSPEVMQTWTMNLSTDIREVLETHTLHMVVLRGMPADARFSTRRTRWARAAARAVLPHAAARAGADAALLRDGRRRRVSHPWTAFPQMIARQAAAVNTSSAEEALGSESTRVTSRTISTCPRMAICTAGRVTDRLLDPVMAPAGNRPIATTYAFAGRFAAQNLTAPTARPTPTRRGGTLSSKAPCISRSKRMRTGSTRSRTPSRHSMGLRPISPLSTATRRHGSLPRPPSDVLLEHHRDVVGAPRLAKAARRHATRRATTRKLRARPAARASSRRRGAEVSETTTSPRAALQTCCVTACTRPTGAERDSGVRAAHGQVRSRRLSDWTRGKERICMWYRGVV